MATIVGQRWKTSDIRLGAYLRGLGYRVINAEKSSGRIVFDFEAKASLQDDMRKYHNREALVEPLNYMALVGELRDLVSQVQRGDTMGGKNGNREAHDG